MDRHNLKGIFNLVIGPPNPIGETMIQDHRIPLISFTGSTGVGRHVAETRGRRLGRTVLELGGSDPFVVLQDADLDAASDIGRAGPFFGHVAEPVTAGDEHHAGGHDGVHDLRVVAPAARHHGVAGTGGPPTPPWPPPEHHQPRR